MSGPNKTFDNPCMLYARVKMYLCKYFTFCLPIQKRIAICNFNRILWSVRNTDKFYPLRSNDIFFLFLMIILIKTYFCRRHTLDYNLSRILSFIIIIMLLLIQTVNFIINWIFENKTCDYLSIACDYIIFISKHFNYLDEGGKWPQNPAKRIMQRIRLSYALLDLESGAAKEGIPVIVIWKIKYLH